MNTVAVKLILCRIDAATEKAENRLRLDAAYGLAQKFRAVGMELKSCEVETSNEKLAGLEIVLSSSISEEEFFERLPKSEIENEITNAISDSKCFSHSRNARRVRIYYRPAPIATRDDTSGEQGRKGDKLGTTVAQDIAALRKDMNWADYCFDDASNEYAIAEKLLEVPVAERKSVTTLAGLKALKNKRASISLADLQSAVDTVLQRKNDTDENYIEQLSARFISRKPNFTFETIVLPGDMLERLDTAVVIADQNVLATYNAWGLTTLDPNPRAILNFYGPPGTGKTHAAEALAHRLGKEIIVAGCKELESKWLGEGPKNVAAAFLAARRSGAVLFFDEADGLISQRQLQEQSGGENQLNAVKNAMLMEVESHKGIVIFASNFVEKYDSAFATRIQGFEFKAPTKDELVKIWETKIPCSAPGRDTLDFDALAELAFRYGFCGRDVRNAAVRAFKDVLYAKRSAIAQADITAACNALICDRKNMEQSNNSHRNTMKFDSVDSSTGSKLETAIADFAKSNGGDKTEKKTN